MARRRNEPDWSRSLFLRSSGGATPQPTKTVPGSQLTTCDPGTSKRIKSEFQPFIFELFSRSAVARPVAQQENAPTTDLIIIVH